MGNLIVGMQASIDCLKGMLLVEVFAIFGEVVI
jgi:hypothetical protein